jgi:WD40 repeat protein
LGHRAEGQSDESSENSVSVIDFRKPFSRFLKIYMKGNHEQLLLPVTFTTEEIGGLIFQQPIRKILLSPDSRSIAVLDRRRLILIPMPDGGWKNEKCPVPIVKENILRGERDLVLEDLFFLGSGQFLLAAVSGVQGGLFIIDSQTFDIVSSVKNQSLDKQIRAIDLSRDGKRVAVLKRSSYGFRNKWWRRARWPTSVEIYDFERLFGWAVP